MAWNEPGGGSKDPWGAGARKGEAGPPDLDDILRKLQQFLGGLFGGKRNGSNGNNGNNGNTRSMSAVGAVVVLVIWLASGIYIVDPAERGVVLTFGDYAETTMPGPHWHIPYPIETVEVVNVAQIRNIEIGFRTGGSGRGASAAPRVPVESLMLTQDENIVDIKLAVQYRVKDARDYLFNVIDPDATLAQATESAVRETIGKSSLDFVLTEGRAEIMLRTETLLQRVMDRYRSGLEVTSVNLQDAQPPEEVQAAFEDVIKSREDEQRLRNEAETYANDIIPRARGAAQRQIEESKAHKARVVAQAEGEASRFTQVFAEYRKAPAVTRERLYLDAVESVLTSAGKVVVDVKGGSNLLYLPLDRMSGVTPMPPDKALERMLPPAASVVPRTQEGQSSDTRDRTRDRGER